MKWLQSGQTYVTVLCLQCLSHWIIFFVYLFIYLTFSDSPSLLPAFSFWLKQPQREMWPLGKIGVIELHKGTVMIDISGELTASFAAELPLLTTFCELIGLNNEDHVHSHFYTIYCLGRQADARSHKHFWVDKPHRMAGPALSCSAIAEDLCYRCTRWQRKNSSTYLRSASSSPVHWLQVAHSSVSLVSHMGTAVTHVCLLHGVLWAVSFFWHADRITEIQPKCLLLMTDFCYYMESGANIHTMAVRVTA